MVNRYYLGNLRLSASVLFSSNTYQKLAKDFQVLDIPWISKTRYYNIQQTMFGVTNEAWDKEQVIIFPNSDEKELILCGDRSCDSPGHNAKYLTYFLYDQIQKKVVAISLTQVTEVGSSNRMGKAGLIKTLQEVKGKEHKIERLTTDRHLQIKKYIRELEEDIDHQFGLWHFSKSIKTKLINASKEKTCEELYKITM